MQAEAIRQEMRVSPEINPASEIKSRTNFIKQQLQKSGLKTLVLGISGGVDSSTCGRLAQLAIDELNAESHSSDYRFIAMRLPLVLSMMKMTPRWHWISFNPPSD